MHLYGVFVPTNVISIHILLNKITAILNLVIIFQSPVMPFILKPRKVAFDKAVLHQVRIKKSSPEQSKINKAILDQEKEAIWTFFLSHRWGISSLSHLL